MNTPKRYRKKPVVVEAMRMPDGPIPADGMVVYRWIESNTLGSFEPTDCIEGSKPWPVSGVSIDPRDGRMIIATHGGAHWVNLGDWIIRDVDGEFCPINPNIFDATYEEDRHDD